MQFSLKLGTGSKIMWTILISNSILFAMGSSLVDEDQNNYLKKLNIDCGVVNQDKIEGASSRIVNAKPSSHTYSWMTQIFVKWYVDEKFISNNDKNFKILDSAGALISDRAVLTCGHCICHESDASKDMPFPFSCGVENPLGKTQENLNIKGKNEIHVSYGRRTKGKLQDIVYNEHIQAFVYKFEKNKKVSKDGWKIFRNNGDIGIVITKERLDLAREKISPICLPSPNTYQGKSGMDVNFVGWGDRLKAELDPTGAITSHSCFTNGARKPDSQLYPDTGGLSIVECNFNKEQNKFCLGGEKDPNGFAKNQVHTFSYRTRIKFNEDMVDYIEEDNYDQKCVKYMNAAEKKWIQANQNLHSDKNYEGID